QIGHPDDVHSPRAIEVRLRSRRELRPLDADVNAALVNARTAFARRLAREGRDAGTDRIGEADVADDAIAEKRIRAMPRSIDELMRKEDVGRVIVLFHRSDGARGENRVHAERLEAVDVRPEIEVA